MKDLDNKVANVFKVSIMIISFIELLIISITGNGLLALLVSFLATINIGIAIFILCKDSIISSSKINK